MSGYLLLFIFLWIASGVIPAIAYEIWRVKTYGEFGAEIDDDAFFRIFIATIFGPIALMAIAVVMSFSEEDEDEEEDD